MKLLVYSATSVHSIETQLGMADYSYYFVKKAFMPVLERIGNVVEITDPVQQVDQLYEQGQKTGELCIFLSFTPPHKTELNLRCPTLCVFAWEYGTLPSEIWGKDEKNDWRCVLGRHGFAITHSEFAADIVRKAMRNDYPIISLPAPLWDSMAEARNQRISAPEHHRFTLSIRGTIIDTRTLNLALFSADERKSFITGAINQHNTLAENKVDIEGVVYTAVFNPNDGRKNWPDLVSAFCWAFRDIEDATLILKLTYRDALFSFEMVTEELRKLLPFRCRVLMIHGFLDAQGYLELIKGTHYAVNSSHGEGQCLPLMEFMSAGKPAVAPNHTAMADYLDPSNGFVVDSTVEWTHWPHDPRSLKRTFRYRVNWESLLTGYQQSYQLIKSNYPHYLLMSHRAAERLRNHCSEAVIEEKISNFVTMRYTLHENFNSRTFSSKTNNKQSGHSSTARRSSLIRKLLQILKNAYHQATALILSRESR